MKHMKAITHIPAPASEDLTLEEILQIIISVYEAIAPLLGKDSTTA